MADEMKVAGQEGPRVANTETGLIERPKPMLVVYHGTQRMPAPGGGEMEVVLFKAWQPDDWTRPDRWGNEDEGSFMAGVDYTGTTKPVLLTSTPIMVKAPGPRIHRGSAADGKRPRGN